MAVDFPLGALALAPLRMKRSHRDAMLVALHLLPWQGFLWESRSFLNTLWHQEGPSEGVSWHGAQCAAPGHCSGPGNTPEGPARLCPQDLHQVPGLWPCGHVRLDTCSSLLCWKPFLASFQGRRCSPCRWQAQGSMGGGRGQLCDLEG